MTQCDQSNQIILILFWLLSWAVLLFCWFRRKWPFDHSDSDWVTLACWLFVTMFGSIVWPVTLTFGVIIGLPAGAAYLAHQVREDSTPTRKANE